jgi:hypothetical protein
MNKINELELDFAKYYLNSLSNVNEMLGNGVCFAVARLKQSIEMEMEIEKLNKDIEMRYSVIEKNFKVDHKFMVSYYINDSIIVNNYNSLDYLKVKLRNCTNLLLALNSAKLEKTEEFYNSYKDMKIEFKE